MARAIKLILYYFAYQLAFLFAGTVAEAVAASAKGVEVTADFRPGITAVTLSTFFSAIVMLWHLIYFKYVRFNKESFCEVPVRTILLSIPLLVPALFFASTVSEMFHLPDLNQSLFVDISHQVFGILAIAIVAPIMEELLFRGAIEGHLLRKGWKPAWAIVVSALIFGFIHGNPAQIPFAFLIGLLFGWLFYRTGSVIPGMVGHLINNSCVVGIMATSTKEELEQTTVETLGPTLTYTWMAVALVIFIFMQIYLNRYLPKPEK